MRLPTIQQVPGIALRAVLRLIVSRLPRACLRLQCWLDCRGLPTGEERMRMTPYEPAVPTGLERMAAQKPILTPVQELWQDLKAECVKPQGTA